MTEISFICSFCRQRLAAPSDMEGQIIDCPSCGKAIEVPLSRTLTLDVRHRKDNTISRPSAAMRPRSANSGGMSQKVNAPQRLIIAIIAPLLLLVLGYGIIDMLISSYDSPLEDFDETWWMWGLVLLLIGGFEYYWFSDRSANTTNDDGHNNEHINNTESTSPSGTAVTICSIIGWICFIFSWVGMYSGGEWGDQDILHYIDYRFARAMGMWMGASIFTIIALIMGIIIRKHEAGISLIVASLVTLIATFFIM